MCGGATILGVWDSYKNFWIFGCLWVQMLEIQMRKFLFTTYHMVSAGRQWERSHDQMRKKAKEICQT